MLHRTNKLFDIRDSFRSSLSGSIYRDESDNLFWIFLNEYSGRSRVDWLAEGDARLTESVIRDLEKASSMLKKGYPYQYIIKYAWFHGLKFTVNEKVLIPRPETEELVQWIADEHSDSKNISLLDVGTGSGCIAITLAKMLKEARVSAIDISDDILEIAHKNARRHEAQVGFRKADIFGWQNSFSDERYDIIVSNPPYVRESEKPGMQINVTGFEPAQALFVPDEDPFRYYRAILSFAEIHLEWGGSIYFEINDSLSGEFADWLAGEGITDFKVRKDIRGKDRMVKMSF